MRPARVGVRLVTVLVVTVAAVSCTSDPQDAYCEAVVDNQAELSEVASSQEEDALFEALPPYRDLQDHSPSDIEGEWEVVVTALEDLESAVDEGDEDEIQEASERLGARQTVEAMASLEQHALDVCGTPLAR